MAEVMEQAARIVWLADIRCPIGHPTIRHYELAEQILSIPELLIKAPDQGLPENPYKDACLKLVYKQSQQDMLAPNNGTVFMKVLVK